jgi:biotin carboxyl carrier protein
MVDAVLKLPFEADTATTLFDVLVEDLAAETGRERVAIARCLVRTCYLVGARRPPVDPLPADGDELVSHQGEDPAIQERIIVAPDTGRFRQLATEEQGLLAGVIRAQQTVGFIDGFRTSTTIRSPFDGVLAGMLALPGEHLERGQPVAWLRTP